MASLLGQRDIGSDVDGVKHTFSSWDACMSKAYCKWPVIIVIIVASLIALSLIWCAARCLCCGVECCCGCLSCCNSCCPSPRRRNRNEYQQAPPTPHYAQYQPPSAAAYASPPVYARGGMGYRSANVPQTARFDAPSKNDDALPEMPSWSAATSRREEIHDDVELEKIDGHGPYHSSQQEMLLSQQATGRYHGSGARTGLQDSPHGGDLGGMTAHPYHDYQQHQQIVPSPYRSQGHGLASPYSSMYEQPALRQGAGSEYFNTGSQHNQVYGQQRRYEASIPPSYHTRPPSETASPVSPQAGFQPQYPGQQTYQSYSNIGRRPVQGSWREV